MLSQQLLSVANLLLNVTIAPLWPAYGEAAARADIAWIRRTFVRSVWVSFVIVLPTFVLVALFGRTVIQLWTGRPDIVPTLSLLMACNIWAIVMAWDRAAAVLLNGLGRMIGQATYGTVIPIFALLIAYVFATKFGAAGVIWVVVGVGGSLRATCLAIDVFFSVRSLGSTKQCIACQER
jgi:O-antigen/teichoic acid export membrane protein